MHRKSLKFVLPAASFEGYCKSKGVFNLMEVSSNLRANGVLTLEKFPVFGSVKNIKKQGIKGKLKEAAGHSFDYHYANSAAFTVHILMNNSRSDPRNAQLGRADEI
jgi:hypothetical protein